MPYNNVVIIQSGREEWRLFEKPVKVLVASALSDVLKVLSAVESSVTRGLYAAGFISYDAAPAFDPALRTIGGDGFPLVWFGIYTSYDILKELPAPDDNGIASDWKLDIEEAQYAESIRRIKDYLVAGDTYQVNFTARMMTEYKGDPYALFYRMARRQTAQYCAFMDTEDFAVCSASPELFFEVKDGVIRSRPMKGTRPRGLYKAADELTKAGLRESQKDMAENVMIVDMIRNDLGRIAKAGSVEVTSSFDIEEYPTVLQMTSTVEAKTDASLTSVLKALFPCASVTGAPKVRTMEIIAEAETSPRGLYTGAIGCVAPDNEMRFNVAIRTAVVRSGGETCYGVGGGIVWDSDAGREYQECLTKAAILDESPTEFELLETMLWTRDEGIFLLDRHMLRLSYSARYFGFRMDERKVRAALAEKVRLEGVNPLPLCEHKDALSLVVRFLLDRKGNARIELAPSPKPKEMAVALAAKPVSSQNVYLYHKTTNRAVYEDAGKSRSDVDDVILVNERGEITESTIANVVIEKNGKLVTPPQSCGLLAGTFRDELLERGEIVEEILHVADLEAAKKLFLINSVRKWVTARLVK